VTGTGTAHGPSDETVATITAAGGTAIADYADISTWSGARSTVHAALDGFGRLDGLVNNAGIMRAGTVDDIDEADLDALIAVHLKGTFGTTRHACAHWRGLAEEGEPVRASVVNTVSEAMLVGLPRYAGYSAMKSAIVGLTLTLSEEGSGYGVRANAYAPRAATRMMPGYDALEPTDEPTISDPANSSPLVAWLLSDRSAHVTGQLFQTVGGGIATCVPWTAGELAWPPGDAVRFTPDDIGTVVEAQLGAHRFRPGELARPPGWPQPVR
jgi:NAD(P)-dependent dehydrogenase (short-subunit alcohol dehydrogenase family)